MNKQQLASKIWESANKMRSKIEANEYKDYILGFIFYKFLSDKEVKLLKEESFTEEDIINLNEENTEVVRYIQRKLGYFIAYEDLFSTWIEKKNDFQASNVTDALSAFSRLINKEHKKVFTGIFDTLQTGLSKLGDTTKARTKAVSELIYLIKDIPMDGKQDYDVIGFIYEYLISMFAANAGKKAGEFYTPHEVSVLMSEIVANHLKEREKIEIYDPTSGSGSLLINIGNSVSKYIKNPDNIKYYAQELKQNTYNLTRMNLVMRGILPDNIVTRNGDTLEDDWPYFDEKNPANTYNRLQLDAVVSNPPYSQAWDSTNKETDPRYKDYGLAPKAKADYAFLLHDLFHIKNDGIMTIVLPHGVLFRGGEEKEIRKNLIEHNNIDAIIGLPANIFFGTGIPTIIMVLRQKRKNTDVQIIDASKGFKKDGKNNKLRASDIKRIVDTLINRKNVEKYSKVVTRDEIRNNDYNLNIPRYVDSSEEPENWDIYASMFGGIPNDEIDKFNKYWNVFQNLKSGLFSADSNGYAKLSVENIQQYIKEHSDIKKYVNNFNKSFEDFEDYLEKELIQNMSTMNISGEESILSDEIFKRLDSNLLIDKYQAYQLLDDNWSKISVDLEIVQTEGFEAARKVDPNIVIKKKDGKEVEVQDGWIGHIIPFEIVQKSKLKKELEQLKQKENRISEILSEYEQIMDSLSEDDKEELKDILNDSNDAFVSKEVAKKAKEISSKKIQITEGTLEYKVVKVKELQDEEKNLRKQVKDEEVRLHNLTKEIIENLSDEEAFEFLKIKWINPLINDINKLPEELINDFAKKLQALSDKYGTTFLDIETQIKESENILYSLIGELQGDEFDMKGLSEFQSLLRGE